MRVIGIILAVLLFVGIIVGLGYGLILGYEFLFLHWGVLSDDWKAILIVVAALLIFCSLLASLSIQSSIKKYGLKGSGKVMAYNDFIHWYSEYKNDTVKAKKTEMLRTVSNQITLWGNSQVVKQMQLLYELKQQDDADREQILKKADHVYIEIRRDLGLRGTSGENTIV